jgi:hypothetical protein
MSPLARTGQAGACTLLFLLVTPFVLGVEPVVVGAAGRSGTVAPAAAAATNPASPQGHATQAPPGSQGRLVIAQTNPTAQAPVSTTQPSPTPHPPAPTTPPSPTPQASAQTTPASPTPGAPAPGTQPGSAPQPASAAQPTPAVVLAPKATAEIARSALLVVQGTAADDALQLTIRRVSDGSLINSNDVTMSIDGKSVAVTHEKPGSSYEVPANDLRGDGSRDSAKDVDIVVAHDGIREVLSSKVAVAEAPSGGGLLGRNKQITWWILNIVIVLVAAMAISRRKG